MIRIEQFSQYQDRLHGVRRSYVGVPAWGRVLLLVAAVPGILLLALSGAIFALSMATLLLLTVPAYALVARIAGMTAGRTRQGDPAAPLDRRPARHVEATVID